MKKNDKSRKVAISAIALGTVAIGSLASTANATNESLFSYQDLGSGAELRSELLSANNAINFIQNSDMELKCGEGEKKATTKDGEKATEHKCGEGKCGEGKCGEGKKTEMKKDAGEKKMEKKEVKSTESKAKESTPERD